MNHLKKVRRRDRNGVMRTLWVRKVKFGVSKSIKKSHRKTVNRKSILCSHKEFCWTLDCPYKHSKLTESKKNQKRVKLFRKKNGRKIIKDFSKMLIEHQNDKIEHLISDSETAIIFLKELSREDRRFQNYPDQWKKLYKKFCPYLWMLQTCTSDLAKTIPMASPLAHKYCHNR